VTNKMNKSQTVGWRTPARLLEPIRQALGGIDLDPCTDDDNPTGATRYYTPETDGLSAGLTGKWSGGVFVNPPCGREIKSWVNAACNTASLNGCGGVGQHRARIVMLVPARTHTRWWAQLWRYTHDCTFVRGTVKFDPPPSYTGKVRSAPFPVAIISLFPWRAWHSSVAKLGITVRGEAGRQAAQDMLSGEGG
jgi:phage N-6-adenine-methyltransferase